MDYALSTAAFNKAFELAGAQPVIPGPFGVYRRTDICDLNKKKKLVREYLKPTFHFSRRRKLPLPPLLLHLLPSLSLPLPQQRPSHFSFFLSYVRRIFSFFLFSCCSIQNFE